MTISESVARLRGDLKEVSADSYISNRHLWNIIYTTGLMYLERDKKNLHNQNIFIAKSFDTEEVNLYENTCVPLDCTVCRFKIPKILSTKNGFLYQYIASPGLSNKFKYKLVSPESYVNKQKIKGNKQKYAFAEGDYIYLSDCIPCVKFSYVSGDLEEGSNCSKLNDDVPFPDYLLNVLFINGLQEMRLAVQKIQDTIVNKNSAI